MNPAQNIRQALMCIIYYYSNNIVLQWWKVVEHVTEKWGANKGVTKSTKLDQVNYI